MRGIKFSRFFPCIGGKHAYQVFIDEAEDIVILPAVHRDIFDQLDQGADRLCLRNRVLSEFTQPGLQRLKNVVEYFFVGDVDQSAEGRKRISDIGDVKVPLHLKPGGKQVFVGNKVTDVLSDKIHGFRIGFVEPLDILLRKIILSEKLYFPIRKVFVKDKSEDVVFVLVCFDF